MRIGLNLLHVLPEIGGGWNYVANLVAALAEYDHDNTYVAFVTRASESLVPNRPNFCKVVIGIHSQSRPQRIFYENTWLQILARQEHLNCMHWFANVQGLCNTVPAVVTVHDLLAFSPLAYKAVFRRVYIRYMMRLTAKSAPLLLPVSQTTANNLSYTLGVEFKRMVVIRTILAPEFRLVDTRITQDLRSRYSLPEQFWLYVAQLYDHKNHERLIKAYSLCKRAGLALWPLVLRGGPNTAEIRLRRLVHDLDLQQVIWLPRLERSDVPALYSAASALVFPSLYEGGGIPVVEALACGCPVIASDIPAVKEFAANAAVYFDPFDVNAIAQAMWHFQTHPDQRQSCRQLGLRRAEEFRPQPIVEKILGAYRQLA